MVDTSLSLNHVFQHEKLATPSPHSPQKPRQQRLVLEVQARTKKKSFSCRASQQSHSKTETARRPGLKFFPGRSCFCCFNEAQHGSKNLFRQPPQQRPPFGDCELFLPSFRLHIPSHLPTLDIERSDTKDSRRHGGRPAHLPLDNFAQQLSLEGAPHLPGTAAAMVKASRRRPHEEKREDRDSKRRRRRKSSALDDLRGRYDQLCSPVDKRLLRHCTNTSELLGDE